MRIDRISLKSAAAAVAISALTTSAPVIAAKPASEAGGINPAIPRCVSRAPGRIEYNNPLQRAEPVILTKHSGMFNGRHIDYVAEVGRLPIRDFATGEVHGWMSYTAYRVPGKTGEAARPITFAWGGGPSGPGSGVDSGYLGPKTWQGETLVDNPATLLPVSDMVFIDPVGTGFSVPARPEFLSEFFTLQGDGASFAEFIRVWLSHYGEAHTSIYLYGPSYGSWRAGVVSEMLETKEIDVTGTMLISGGILLGPDVLSPMEKAAYRVPAQAATAFHFGKLDPALGRSIADVTDHAQGWVESVYLPALQRIGSLSPAEREDIARGLARYTGYPLGKIDRKVLAFSQPDYRRNLLGNGQTVDFLDMRDVATHLPGRGEQARQLRYIREELGFCSDLAYGGLEQGYTAATQPPYKTPGEQWKYDIAEGTAVSVDPLDEGVGPSVKGRPWMVDAIRINPKLKVFVGVGLFDSMNSCAGNLAQLRRVEVAVAQNFTAKCYENGHRMGVDPKNLANLGTDLRGFIERTRYRPTGKGGE